MVQVMPVDPVAHLEAVDVLFTEYLTWLNHNLQISYCFGFDVPTAVENDLHSLERFLPPHGHMLLLYRSFSFTDISPYPESEVPPQFHADWLFMALPQ